MISPRRERKIESKYTDAKITILDTKAASSPTLATPSSPKEKERENKDLQRENIVSPKRENRKVLVKVETVPNNLTTKTSKENIQQVIDTLKQDKSFVKAGIRTDSTSPTRQQLIASPRDTTPGRNDSADDIRAFKQKLNQIKDNKSKFDTTAGTITANSALQTRIDQIAAASRDSRGSVETAKEKIKPKMPHRSTKPQLNEHPKFRRSKSVEAREPNKDGVAWFEVLQS